MINVESDVKNLQREERKQRNKENESFTPMNKFKIYLDWCCYIKLIVKMQIQFSQFIPRHYK